jgi:hypothetical protein
MKYRFPEIQNLTVDMNKKGEISISFNKTIYTQEQVEDFIMNFKK